MTTIYVQSYYSTRKMRSEHVATARTPRGSIIHYGRSTQAALIRTMKRRYPNAVIEIAR